MVQSNLCLRSIELENYRCFERLCVDLHPQMTVIVAENGQGKSSLLDAIRVGLWPFISSFDLAKSSGYSDPQNSIDIKDVRQVVDPVMGMKRQLPTTLSLDMQWQEKGQDIAVEQWTRLRISEADRTKTRNDDRAKQLIKWASSLQEQIRLPEGDALQLPVFGYYGTGRLWQQKRFQEQERGSKRESEKDDFYVRTFAYRHCMDPASSFKYFRDWFIWAWKSRSNMNERKSASVEDKLRAQTRIEVVQGAIDKVLKESTGWHTLEFSFEDQESLILNHSDQGYFSVDQLSDGLRSMLAMVGDIAYRCVRLNPQLGAQAAEEAQGVILIDEVDMHLHPRWQQTILASLQSAFPKMQFIVTTHSPQVITTVGRDNIRIIQPAETGYQVVTPDYSPLAHESGDALAHIMNTHAQPPLTMQEAIREYEQLVRDGKEGSSEARRCYEELTQQGYQFSESDLVTWRFLAQRKANR